MLMLLLKGRQIQDGASWDNVVTITVAILLIGCASLIVALVGSRVLHALRMRRHHRGPRRSR